MHTNSLSFTSYLFMVAGTMKIPTNKLDIRPLPAGGSFGSKLFATKPAVIAGMCSREVGRPVQYLEDRVDNISNCDHHGSDRVYDVQLAVMRDGTMRGIKIDTVDDYGAYIQFGVGHHGNALAQVVGPYAMTSVEYRVRAALTNKNQQGAYRGFGSEVNNWMLEQLVDKAARELDLDPVEIRRRNFIREFPHFIPTGNVYDSGDYDAVLDKALELAQYEHWRAEQVQGPCGGALHRHRADHRAGALGVLGDRVLVLVRRAGRARDVDAGVGDAQGGRDRRDHRDAVLLRVLGQLARRRWSRSWSPRSSTATRTRCRSSTRAARTACPPPDRAAPAPR